MGLYEEPERPPNAVDYIKRYMGAPNMDQDQNLVAENQRLQKDLEAAKKEIDALKEASAAV